MRHLRDSEGWKSFGLPLSTTSNEVCKLYDAALTQYVGFLDDPQYGGLQATVAKMIETDPNFVFGRAFQCQLKLMSQSETTRLNAELKKEVDNLTTLANSSPITPRELLFVEAVKYYADGDFEKAGRAIEDLTIDHPNDIHALRFYNDLVLFQGKMHEMRNMFTRCMPAWNENVPLYEYYLAHLSFGYEETFYYDDALSTARKALQLNPEAGWATHTVAHVHEMKCETDEGLKILENTMSHWAKPNNLVRGHTYWHVGLYHLEKGDYESALSIFDDHLINEAVPHSLLGLLDTSSLLYRLQFEGQDVGDRWKQVLDVYKGHTENHINSLVDTHLAMAMLYAKDEDLKNKFLETLKDWVRNGKGFTHSVFASTTHIVVDAMVAYEAGQYAQAVELLLPIRYQHRQIGGSLAQLDVFNLLLIHSAMQSDRKSHLRLARMLLAERDGIRRNSPMSERLAAKALAACPDD